MSLKLLRLALHMNTTQAARYLAARPDYPEGVNETTWVRWESGKKEVPSDLLEHLEHIRLRLADCLDKGQVNSNDDSVLTQHIKLATKVNQFVRQKT